ncbi:MAG: DUF3817 domain-containing protein [Kineosporiaceae bacterium]
MSTATPPGTTPGADKPVRPAFLRYRTLAWATGVFLVLLTVHVLVQWRQWAADGIAWEETEGLGRWIPGADAWVPITHGYLYLAYVLITVDLWLRTRLPVVRTVLVVVAGTVPFMSFVAERWVHRQLAGRLAAERPAGA